MTMTNNQALGLVLVIHDILESLQIDTDSMHAIPGDWIVYEDCPMGSTPEVWVMPNVDKVEHFK